MLDDNDLKILSIVDTNARITIANIAKEAKSTKSRAQYRLNGLIERGIIKKFVTQPSLSRLGYFLGKFYLSISGMDSLEKKKFIDELCKNKTIGWVAKSEGQWDILIGVYVKNILELHRFKKDFMTQYGKNIESIDVVLAGEGYTSQRTYLSTKEFKNPKVVKDFVGSANESIQELDSKDRQILRLISNNARYNLVDIHKKTKLDVKTIKKKIQDMEKKGIIQGYVTFLDINKMGYQYFKICIYLKNQDEIEKIISFGTHHPNIIHIIETIGSWELEFEVETKSFDDMFKIQNELKDKYPNSIKKTTSTIIIEEQKLVFIPEEL